jgi:hypothetical protein
MTTMSDSNTRNSWIAPTLAGVFSLLGVGLGNHLNQQNSFALLQRQQRFEMRNTSYAKLMGLKLAWAQAIHTNSEAQLLSEYYDARFHMTGNHDDLDEAKRQNDRGIALIPRISDLQREVFQALGDVQLGFAPTAELEAAVDAIYRYRTINVKPAGLPRTVKELDAWKEENTQRLPILLKQEYEVKFDNLLQELLRQLRQGKPAS